MSKPTSINARQTREYLLSKSKILIDGWIAIIEQATKPLDTEWLLEGEEVPEAPDPQLIRALNDAIKMVAPPVNMTLDNDISALAQTEVEAMFGVDTDTTPATVKTTEIMKKVLSGKITPEQGRRAVDTAQHLFTFTEEFQLKERLDELLTGKNMPHVSRFGGIRH